MSDTPPRTRTRPPQPEVTEPQDVSSYQALRVEKKAIADLNPHPENPRKHPPQGSEDWNKLKDSLKHDYFDPIVWNERNGLLVSGHLRRKVLISLGVTHADVVVVDYDEDTHIARMFAANEGVGKDDREKAKALLNRISPSAQMLTGMGDKRMEALRQLGSKEVSAEPTYPITAKLGEKHDYVIIFTDNETDRAFLHQLLGVRKEKSYKSSEIGTGRAVPFARAIASLVKNKASLATQEVTDTEEQ